LGQKRDGQTKDKTVYDHKDKWVTGAPKQMVKETGLYKLKRSPTAHSIQSFTT